LIGGREREREEEEDYIEKMPCCST